ncbi:unnamed protein product, partial [Larinioides sclopetarius]
MFCILELEYIKIKPYAKGYVALDDVKFDRVPNSEVCIGHCTFEGGFCDWKNMDEDDFDW